MTSPQLSPQQREQADKIFKQAQKQALWGLMALTMVGSLLITIIAERLFHVRVSPGWIGGMYLLWFGLAQMYATRQVRKAGLSLDRKEIQFFPRTAPHFTGPPLDIHSDFTVTNGCWGGGVVLVLGALLTWYQSSGHGFNPLMASGGFFILIVCLVQAAYCLSDPPVLQLDERGVFNGPQHFWPQRASWSHIRKAEWQQTFDYKGHLTMRKLIFRTLKGRDVVILLPKAQFSGPQTEEIITQIEAALTGESKIHIA